MSVSGQYLFCQPENLLSFRVRKGVGSSLRMPRRKSRRLSTRGSIPFCKIVRLTAPIGCVILIPFYGSGLLSVLPCSGPVGGYLDTPPGFRRLAPDGLVPRLSPLSPTAWQPPREGPAPQSPRADPAPTLG